MSSGRKRRTGDEHALKQNLEESWVIRWSLYALAGFGLLALVETGGHAGTFAGDPLRSITAVIAVYATALIMFNVNHEDTARSNSRIILLFGGIFLHLLAVRGVGNVIGRLQVDPMMAFLAIPFALAPMIHSVLLGRNHGVFSAIFVSLFGCLMITSDQVLQYIVMSLVAGFIAVYLTRNVRRRGSLLRAGFYVGAVCLILAYAFGLIGLEFNDPESLKIAAWKSLTTFGTGVLTAMVISGLLPMLEGVFGLTTPISWLELSDLNHRLLRRMQLEIPGTFHHSLVVASLSEAAAEEIGANAVMCRVCSYFHDIGKLNKPSYFIENQIEGQVNPHDALTPTMSALVIIAHVKDGVDLAMKHKLNKEIVDVISEHHGDSLVAYFYHKAVRQRDEMEEAVEKGEGNADDLPNVDKKSFQYPGPRPRSRESGIISLADACESASRTLKKPTPRRIRALIDEIVGKRIADGQLDDCGLTLAELGQVRASFAKTLRSMLHSRIDYPDDAKKSPKKSAKKDPAEVKKTDDDAKEAKRVEAEAEAGSVS